MAWTRINHIAAGSTDGNGFTTSSIDTTNANFLVMAHAHDIQSNVVSDSKSNTWSTLTIGSNGNARLQISYVTNPIVGTGHTFSCHLSAGNFPSLALEALSGGDTISPFNVENGATITSATTIQPGSITPGQNGELIILAVEWNTVNTGSVDSGLTISDQVDFLSAKHYGVGLAWLGQGTAAAINPTWTYGVSVANGIARIASFKPNPYVPMIDQQGMAGAMMIGQSWV